MMSSGTGGTGGGVLGDKTNGVKETTSAPPVKKSARSRFRKLAQKPQAGSAESLEERQKVLAADLERTLAMLSNDSRYSGDAARHYTDKDKHKDQNVVELLRGQKKHLDALNNELTREKLMLREKNLQLETWRNRAREMSEWKDRCLQAESLAGDARHLKIQLERSTAESAQQFHRMCEALREHREQIEYLEASIFQEQWEARESLEEATAQLGQSMQGLLTMQQEYEAAIATLQSRNQGQEERHLAEMRRLQREMLVAGEAHQESVQSLQIQLVTQRTQSSSELDSLTRRVESLTLELQSAKVEHEERLEQQMQSDSFMMKMMADSLETEVAAKQQLAEAQESLIGVIAERDSQLEIEKEARIAAEAELVAVTALTHQFSEINESNRTVLESVEKNLDEMKQSKQRTSDALAEAQCSHAEQSVVLSQTRLEYLEQCEKNKGLRQELIRKSISNREATFLLQEELRDQQTQHQAAIEAIKKQSGVDRAVALGLQRNVFVSVIDDLNLELENSTEAFQLELQLVKETHRQETVVVVDELVGKQLLEVNSLEERLRASVLEHQTEVTSLQNLCVGFQGEIAELRQEAAAMRTDRENFISKLNVQHSAEMESLEGKLRDELLRRGGETVAALERGHSLDIEILSKKHSNLVESLKRDHAQECKAMSARHSRELSSQSIRNEQRLMNMRAEMDNLLQRHKEELESSSVFHRQAISSLEMQHTAKIDDLQSQLVAQTHHLEELQNVHSAQLEELSKSHAESIHALELELVGLAEKESEEAKRLHEIQLQRLGHQLRQEAAVQQESSEKDHLATLAQISAAHSSEAESHRQTMAEMQQRAIASEKRYSTLISGLEEKLEETSHQHATEVARLKSLHEEQTSELHMKYFARCSDLEGTASQETQRLRSHYEELMQMEEESHHMQLRELRKTLVQLEQQHEVDLTMRSKYDAAFQRMHQRLKANEASHLEELEKSAENFQLFVEAMKENHTSELQTLSRSHQQTTTELASKNAQVVVELEMKHQAKLVALEAAHTAAVEDIATEAEGAMMSLHRNHSAQRKQLTENFRAEVDAAQRSHEALEGQLKRKIDDLESNNGQLLEFNMEEELRVGELEAQVSALKQLAKRSQEMHKEELADLVETHRQSVERLERQMVDLKEAHSLEIEASLEILNQNHKVQLAALQDTHQRAMLDAKNLAVAKLAAVQKAGQQRSEQFQLEVGEKLSDRDKVIEQMNTMLERQQEVIDRAQAEMVVLEDAREEAEETVFNLQQKMLDTVAYLDELGGALQAREAELTSLQQAKKRADLAAIDLESFAAGQCVDAQRMTGEICALAADRQELEGRLQSLTQERDDLRSELELLQKSNTKLELDMLNLESFVSGQMVTHQQLVEEAASMQEALREADAINEEMAAAWQRQTQSEVEARIRELMAKLEGKLIEKTSTLL